MNKRFLAPTMASMMALFGFNPAMAESGVTIYGNIDASVVTATGIGLPWNALRCAFSSTAA